MLDKPETIFLFDALTFFHIGTQIGTCLKLPNVEPHYWGPDPERWDPERWEHLPETYKEASMPGPAGLTTFSNGPASW